MAPTTRAQAERYAMHHGTPTHQRRAGTFGLDALPMEILMHIAECVEDAASLASFSAACTKMKDASFSSLYARFFATKGLVWVTGHLLGARDPLLESPSEDNLALATTLLDDVGRGLWQARDLPEVEIKTRWAHLQLPYCAPDTESRTNLFDPISKGVRIRLVHMAAACGLDTLTRCLVNHGADLVTPATNTRRGLHRFWLDDTSPLALAISNQRRATAELLLDLGAKASSGWEAALRVGRADFVALLIKHDPDLPQRRVRSLRNPGRDKPPLQACLESCTRDPVAIFRLFGRDGFNMENDQDGLGRHLPRAIAKGFKETASLLAREYSTIADIAPVLGLMVTGGAETSRRMAESCLRIMITARRVQASDMQGGDRHIPTVVSGAPSEAIEGWARLDRLHRLLGVTEPLILYQHRLESTHRGMEYSYDTLYAMPRLWGESKLQSCLQQDLNYIKMYSQAAVMGSPHEELDARQLHISSHMSPSSEDSPHLANYVSPDNPETTREWIQLLKEGRDLRRVTYPSQPWPWRTPSRDFTELMWRRADTLADLDRPDEEWRELVHRPLLEWALATYHHPVAYPPKRSVAPSARGMSDAPPASLELSIMDTGTYTESVANDAREIDLRSSPACCLQYVEEDGREGLRRAHKVVSILATGPCARPGASRREMEAWHQAHEESLCASGIIDRGSLCAVFEDLPEICFDFLWGLIIQGHHWSLVAKGLAVDGRSDPKRVMTSPPLGISRLGETPIAPVTKIGSTDTPDGIHQLAMSLPIILAWVDRLYVGPLAERLKHLAGRRT